MTSLKSLWRNRLYYFFTPLMVLGVWRVADGDYYRNGHWQWRFWTPIVVDDGNSIFIWRWPFTI